MPRDPRSSRGPSRGCCGAGPPRVPARPRSRARSPRGSPAGLRGPRGWREPGPVAEGARGTGKAELFGERERPVGDRDRVLGPPLEGIGAATSVSAPTSSGEGPSGSSSSQRLHRERPVPRIPEPGEHAAERRPSRGRRRGGHPALGTTRSPPPGLGRLGVAPGLQGGLAEAGERLGAFGVSRRGERERPFEVRKRRRGVQAERPLPGEGQELERRCLELGRLLGLSGGPRELQGRRVVVGEDVGEVLDAFGGLGLDPRRRGDVTRGSRGSRELPVGDVAGQDVPERVLGLALDRGTPGRTHELLARELPQRLGDLGEVAFAHLCDRTGPEDLPDRRRRRRASTSCRPRACPGVRRSGPGPSRGTGPRPLPAAPSSRPS